MRRILLVLALVSATSQVVAGEVFCKHFLHGQPKHKETNDNDLVIRDCYALSNNATTKFADWVAFRLTPHEVFGTLDLEREWRDDEWLDATKTLEAKPAAKDDYKGANSIKYDRGHLAPLASFKGSRHASQVNFYSNIVPQKSDLNQGPWQRLEDAVRKLTLRHQTLWVITGPLYERDMPKLPQADEGHTVPSGFWQIVMVQPKPKAESIRVAAFIFDQDTPRKDKLVDHVTTIREVEKRAKLDFLRMLPDELEEAVEAANNRAWVQEEFELSP